MKFGVLRFPGSCDEVDAALAAGRVGEAEIVWHRDRDLGGFDAIIVPGGFSYGDYLRAGAIARFSPAMESVVAFAGEGGLVLGICNGFQVLCEAGLLPGALLPNANRRFTFRQVDLEVSNRDTAFTVACRGGEEGRWGGQGWREDTARRGDTEWRGDTAWRGGGRSRDSESRAGKEGGDGGVSTLSIPAKHSWGRWYAPRDELERVEQWGQVVLRYRPLQNFNGSVGDVAGVCNEGGNVFGMMPHPEHAVDPLMGSCDGLLIFESMRLAVEAAGG